MAGAAAYIPGVGPQLSAVGYGKNHSLIITLVANDFFIAAGAGWSKVGEIAARPPKNQVQPYQVRAKPQASRVNSRR